MLKRCRHRSCPDWLNPQLGFFEGKFLYPPNFRFMKIFNSKREIPKLFYLFKVKIGSLKIQKYKFCGLRALNFELWISDWSPVKYSGLSGWRVFRFKYVISEYWRPGIRTLCLKPFGQLRNWLANKLFKIINPFAVGCYIFETDHFKINFWQCCPEPFLPKIVS